LLGSPTGFTTLQNTAGNMARPIASAALFLPAAIRQLALAWT